MVILSDSQPPHAQMRAVLARETRTEAAQGKGNHRGHPSSHARRESTGLALRHDTPPGTVHASRPNPRITTGPEPLARPRVVSRRNIIPSSPSVGDCNASRRGRAASSTRGSRLVEHHVIGGCSGCLLAHTETDVAANRRGRVARASVIVHGWLCMQWYQRNAAGVVSLTAGAHHHKGGHRYPF